MRLSSSIFAAAGQGRGHWWPRRFVLGQRSLVSSDRELLISNVTIDFFPYTPIKLFPRKFRVALQVGKCGSRGVSNPQRATCPNAVIVGLQSCVSNVGRGTCQLGLLEEKCDISRSHCMATLEANENALQASYWAFLEVQYLRNYLCASASV